MSFNRRTCNTISSLKTKILSSFFRAFIITILFSSIGLSKDNSNSKDVLKTTLKNGLKVVIVKDELAPVVTTEINYLVGSNETPKGYPGTAHALEHMMFRGSKGLSGDQLDEIDALLGGYNNAETRQTVTQYYYTIPSEDLDIALKIESLRMQNILCADSIWNIERGAIEQEVASDLSNPQYVFFNKLRKKLFKGTPYEHDALGTKPSFDKTTGKMLRQFHDSWYAPNNAILVIAGNIDLNKTLNQVKDMFDNIPEKELQPKPKINLSPIKKDSLNLTTDLPYGYTLIVFRMPGVDSKDYAALQILSDVLSSHRGDLYGLVPLGKALYAGFGYNALPETGYGYILGAFPKGANTKNLINETESVVQSYLQKGFPKDLVEAAKRHELTDAEFQKNSISGLASVWSEAIAVEGRNSPQDDLDMLKQVTVNEVNRVAKKYLNFDHAIYATLSPQSSGKPISKSGFGGSESFAPSNPQMVPLPNWAKGINGKLKVPDSHINPVVSTLSNGIKLIVQPENISNTISLYGEIRTQTDLQEPKGKDGVSDILDQLFEYGTTNLNRIQFQKALDDIGANESAGTRFSLSTLSNQFDKGLELLSGNLLSPALPEQAFPIIQRQLSQTVAGELKSPDYLTNRAITVGLVPNDDPSLRKTTPKTINSIKMNDVKSYYNKIFRPDLTTIVVTGNVNPDSVKGEVEKYFGSWKAEGSKPDLDLPPLPPNKVSETAVPDQSRVQDKVILAETLQLNRFDPDYYALQLGNHVLSGAFFTKLYQDLRVTSGLVYFVNSSFGIGKTRSHYSINYGCDPPNVSKAKKIVERDLKEMQTKDVSIEDLNRAKALILRRIQLAESSLGSISYGLLSRGVEGLPLDEPTIAAKKYINLTSQEVKAAFSKWIRPVDLIQVTEGPEPK